MLTSKQTLLPEKYAVIPRVLIFPINAEDQFLLIQGSPSKKIWPNLWNGLGGHVEKGESIFQAAKRELKEESGLEAGLFQFAGQVQVDTETNTGIAVFVFLARDLSGELKASEEGELAWKSLEDALGLPLVEDLYTLLPLISKLDSNFCPFWGVYRYDQTNQLIIDLAY